MTEDVHPPVEGSEDPSDATPTGDRRNRVHWFAGRVHEVLDELTAGGIHVAELDATECAEPAVELSRAARRLDALCLAVLAQGARPDVDVAASSGAPSTGAWFAHATVTPHGT